VNPTLIIVAVIVVGCCVLGPYLVYAIGPTEARRPKIPRGKLTEGPYFAGPALTGTARVLSAGSTRSKRDPKGYFSMAAFPWELALRAEVPGLQPYDVTVTQFLPAWSISYKIPKAPVFKPDILTVEVDSEHPERVRIVGDEEGRWYA
jgi:hypothetical protein